MSVNLIQKLNRVSFIVLFIGRSSNAESIYNYLVAKQNLRMWFTNLGKHFDSFSFWKPTHIPIDIAAELEYL